jgi:alkylhydroperoxidase family enzyme
LDATDRAVIDFATRVATDATSVSAGDVERLRECGLDDGDVVSVVLAAAARAFFTKVIDALGVEADAQLGDTFDPEVRQQLTVGRPIATA